LPKKRVVKLLATKEERS
jgi:SWI/SNF-related matrix-associated actin-dependent regulator of chromatin subfamily A member 5